MASVLETFMFLFTSDTSDVTDGADEARREAERMSAEINHAGDVAGRVGGAFKDLVMQAGAMLAAYATAASFGERAEEITAIGRASETLGESVSDIDAFADAAIRLGGETQGAIDSLTDAAEIFGDASLDPSGSKAEALKAIGISARDATGEVKSSIAGMMELADAVAGLSSEEAIFKLKEVGITDNRTIDLLRQGRKAIEELMQARKQLGGVTQEDVDELKKFKSALAGAGQTVGEWQDAVMIGAMPALTTLVDGFTRATEYLGKHKTATVAFFGAVGAALLYVYTPAMVSAALATWAVIGPFVAMGALVAVLGAAFALVVEDMVAFDKGQKSLIGDISKKWPIIGDLVHLLIGAFNLLWDTWSSIGRLLRDMWDDPSAAWDRFISDIGAGFTRFKEKFLNLDAIVQPIKDAYKSVTDSVMGMFDDIAAYISGVLDKIIGWLTGLKDRAADAVKGVGNDLLNLVGLGDDEEDTAAPAVDPAQMAREYLVDVNAAQALAATPSSAIGQPVPNSSRETTVNVGAVTVNTQATDADGVATALNDSLNQQLRQAANDFDDGIAG